MTQYARDFANLGPQAKEKSMYRSVIFISFLLLGSFQSTLASEAVTTKKKNLFAVRVVNFLGIQEAKVSIRKEIRRFGSYWTLGAHFNPELDLGTADLLHGPDSQIVAVLVPLKHLMKQVIHLGPLDTFVLGEFSLLDVPEATVIYPQSAPEEFRKQFDLFHRRSDIVLSSLCLGTSV